MAKKNFSSGSFFKQFFIVSVITAALFLTTYLVKFVQTFNSKAATKPNAPILLNTRIFWPSTEDYIESSSNGTNLAPYIVGNKIIFTQPLPTYSAYYASQFSVDYPFTWINNLSNPDLETTAMLYGYTTANCTDNLLMAVNIVPVVGDDLLENQDISLVEFNNLPSEYCGQDPTRSGYRWFKMPSDGQGTANTFSGTITQLGLILWQANTGIKTWEISKVVLCNPNSDESGCPLEPWPQPRQMGFAF